MKSVSQMSTESRSARSNHDNNFRLTMMMTMKRKISIRNRILIAATVRVTMRTMKMTRATKLMKLMKRA